MSDQLEPELERVAQMLAAAGPLPSAPESLRGRVLAIPDGGPAAEDEAVAPVARRSWRRPRPIALAGLAAAVVAIAIVPAVAVLRDDSGGGTQQVDLVGRPFAPHGGGSANVVAHGDGDSTIKLTVWKMPSAGSGRTYEAWLGRTGDRYAARDLQHGRQRQGHDHLPGAAQGARQLSLVVGHQRARRRQREARQGHGALGPADLTTGRPVEGAR